ncbi:3-deoxy-manno-octulosonate cytidylyltransferase [Legionella pneumophila serogroup 1]|uniref:3-deoxy-manno-octulosonate cytidylyltransferase n=1 Tax=Legionella pneumophila TaxID=446 RepID=UPI0007707517|nr:3-deoxy-manno-octulosonate cytidylyltransferase [Legionella pneumophila]HAT9012171.1 3-deoxy-manno-octulosonate cytidylyltransferase [Legionella pneumophila subsp. pneumophila]QIB24667.1 3-deoxy-manno-octulosonate cytidylyltransferase [Legionella pneumophila]CZH24159.1 3-deoxy-manno-octulosonate cytidylyltransferase [Legionella pneumophila]HAT9525026.1 3-deoxy-manno-octulosonate cytidylyltransferase [Legionella pneumophila subsp. pneumophila]HAU0206609.1 3-deoxy-manno-octulosonate cytidylyl
MSHNFHVIIPARYHSSRFPGKLLQEINGITVIERVYRQALLAEPKSVIIATDHDEIAEHAIQFGAEVVITSQTHQTGTDRIAEVVAKGGFAPDDVIVNVQGDEPFIRPKLIQQVAGSLTKTKAPVSTLCWPISSLEILNNPNVVKVVRTRDNHALYFSRSAIPFHRDDKSAYCNTFRHIGLYAYRAAFLLEFVSWPPCTLEQIECLEQLRILWAGFSIRVDEACEEPLQDINTKEDLILAQQYFLDTFNV